MRVRLAIMTEQRGSLTRKGVCVHECMYTVLISQQQLCTCSKHSHTSFVLLRKQNNLQCCSRIGASCSCKMLCFTVHPGWRTHSCSTCWAIWCGVYKCARCETVAVCYISPFLWMWQCNNMQLQVWTEVQYSRAYCVKLNECALMHEVVCTEQCNWTETIIL